MLYRFRISYDDDPSVRIRSHILQENEALAFVLDSLVSKGYVKLGLVFQGLYPFDIGTDSLCSYPGLIELRDQPARKEAFGAAYNYYAGR